MQPPPHTHIHWRRRQNMEHGSCIRFSVIKQNVNFSQLISACLSQSERDYNQTKSSNFSKKKRFHGTSKSNGPGRQWDPSAYIRIRTLRAPMHESSLVFNVLYSIREASDSLQQNGSQIRPHPNPWLRQNKRCSHP